MDDKMMKIGEMARFNRVSITTLRLYDKVGILKPCYTDPETNYRYYSIHQKARLDMIQYMKELGMGCDRYRLVDIDQADREISLQEAVKDVVPFVAVPFPGEGKTWKKPPVD